MRADAILSFIFFIGTAYYLRNVELTSILDCENDCENGALDPRSIASF